MFADFRARAYCHFYYPVIQDRISFLDSCSRFGNVFVGRQSGFDLYRQSDLDTGSQDPKPKVSVSLKGQLRWLSVSSCGLTVLASTVSDGKTENTFFDTRTLLKGESAPFARQVTYIQNLTP